MDAVLEPPQVIYPAPLAEVTTIERAAEALGLTAKAIQRKIEQGVWIEGRQYHRAKDNRIYIDLPGVARWVRHKA